MYAYMYICIYSIQPVHCLKDGPWSSAKPSPDSLLAPGAVADASVVTSSLDETSSVASVAARRCLTIGPLMGSSTGSAAVALRKGDTAAAAAEMAAAVVKARGSPCTAGAIEEDMECLGLLYSGGCSQYSMTLAWESPIVCLLSTVHT